MPLSLKFRLRYRKGNSVKAPQILAKEMKGGLEAVGKRLITSAHSRMRKDTGASRKSLKSVVTGKGLGYKLEVYSTVVQAFIDAYGLRAGVRPPFAVGTNLYRWASRRVTGRSSERVKTYHAPPSVTPTPKLKRKGRVRGTKKIRRLRKAGGKGTAVQTIAVSARQKAKNADAKRLAFLVARAIFKRGIKGTQWNYKTLQANRKRIIQEMSNAISRAVVKMNRG